MDLIMKIEEIRIIQMCFWNIPGQIEAYIKGGSFSFDNRMHIWL